MSFATFHYKHCTFFYAKFHSYVLTVYSECIRVFSSFSFSANSLMSSIYIRWLIFSCDLFRLYPAVHFLTMWLSGIMAIMDSKGDRAALCKIPIWIFTSTKLLTPAPGFHGFVDKVYDFLWYFTFRGCLISSYAELYHLPFCSQSRP